MGSMLPFSSQQYVEKIMAIFGGAISRKNCFHTCIFQELLRAIMFEIGWGPDTENKQTDNGQNSLKSVAAIQRLQSRQIHISTVFSSQTKQNTAALNKETVFTTFGYFEVSRLNLQIFQVIFRKTLMICICHNTTSISAYKIQFHQE